MRAILLASGLLLVPAAATAGGMEYGGGYKPAPKHVWKDRGELAGGQNASSSSMFCENGTATASQTSVSCGSRWIAVDGTQFGPVANPANTPKTPYPGSNMVWSSSQYGTAGAPSAVWSGEGVGSTHDSGQYARTRMHRHGGGHGHSRQVVVTRGSETSTVYPGNWCQANSAHARCSDQSTSYSGAVSSSSSQVSGSSYSAQGASECFSYGANGQPYAVACQGAYEPQQTSVWQSGHVSQGSNVSQGNYVAPDIPCANRAYRTGGTHKHYTGCNGPVVANLPPPPLPQPEPEISIAFFNGLNGGVGDTGEIWTGGGGGYYAETGGSTSVFARAPLLRFRHRNTGHSGGHMHHGGGKMHHGGGNMHHGGDCGCNSGNHGD